ncbi:MAG: RNA methyltransferase [Ornithinimicrobium sp.]
MSERHVLLTNPRSERVKSVAALGRRAVRARRGLFVVEGPHAVSELIQYAGDHLVDLYVTADAADRHPEVVAGARSIGGRVYECADHVLAVMADTQHPQGVVAVARSIDVPLTHVLADIGEGFVAVLNEVRDPGNAGTVIRAADAFGARAVVLTDASVDLHHPKVIRSTVGSVFHLPISLGLGVDDVIAACRAAGVRVLAADGAGQTLLPDADLSGPHAWLLGNEARGLPAGIRRASDDIVAVPIAGSAESLNLAMAATVCLHASAATRHTG